MRYFDETEAAELNAEQWQIDLLAANPGYCSWGPHEDYMWNKSEGWDRPLEFASWQEFGPFDLNDLNECVNFYFSVSRANTECTLCSGNGYHPDAQQTARTFYRHSCEPGEIEWNDKITEDEAAALVAAGRGKLDKLVTAADFNAANKPGSIGFGHDAINRFILIEARLKRLGLPKNCPTCEGNGYVFTADAAHVSLTLWWLHPRKGCSRGFEITNVERDDLPAIKAFLVQAAQRNAERFHGLSSIACEETQP